MAEAKLYLFHEDNVQPIKVGSGQRLTLHLIEPKLESDLPLRQFEGVAKVFEQAVFVTWMRGLFGIDIPDDAYKQLHSDLRSGSVTMPKLQLKRAVPKGNLAAYDSEQNAMLFSHKLIRRARDEEDPDGRWLLVAALLEEFGHHVDHLLRNKYTGVGGDAPLDEGAKFAYALLNLDWHARESGEVARLVYPFGPKPIQAQWTEYKEQITPWVSGEQQSDEDRWRQYEFFGAGRGGDNGHSFGHQSVEDALKDASPLFTPEVRLQVYFGNWLRDMSQAICPKSLLLFTRDFYTKMLDLKARQLFEDKPHFTVTKDVLGVYRTEEHLDNPKGVGDGTAADPDLNKVDIPAQSEIDSTTWLQKHLRTHIPGYVSGFECVQAWLRKSMGSSGPERYRHFGAALHALEDFYSHTNFLEVTMIERGFQVYPWTGPFKVVRDGRQTEIFPLVTGVFGGDDTAVSLILENGEKMQKAEECVPGERTHGAEIARLALTDWRPSWGHRFESYLEWREKIGKEYPRLDTMMCESLGALLRVLNYASGAVVRVIGNQIDDAQTLFLTDPKSFNPTHSQIAKDHDDHPLHELAAECAQTAVRHIGKLMAAAWTGTGTVEQVIDGVSAFMTHPAQIKPDSPAWALVMIIEDWAKRNPAKVQRLASRSWIEEVSKSDEWHDFERRAHQISELWDDSVAEAERARQIGLEKYARKKALEFSDAVQRSIDDARKQGTGTLEEYRKLAAEKRAQLTKKNLEMALQELEKLADAKAQQLQKQGTESFRQYQLLVQRKYAELTSPEVRKRYEEAARREAERVTTELRSFTDQKVQQIKTEAEKRKAELDKFAREVKPSQVFKEKVEQLRKIVDAKAQAAADEIKRMQDELASLVKDVKKEIEDPPPPSEFQKLLEREAVALEAKLRNTTAQAKAKWSDPATRAEIEAFIQKQVRDFKRLLQSVYSDVVSAPEQKRLTSEAQKQVDRVHEESKRTSDGIPSQAQQAAGKVKPSFVGKANAESDHQLEYVKQLTTETRGIEKGR